MFFKKRTRLRAIESILEYAGGGVFKRIDENRELLELLQRESPEFLQKHPWVNGWIEAHDEFFTELAKSAQMQASPGCESRPYGDNTTPLNILIVAQGGFGGHHIEDSLKKELPDASVTLRKKGEFTPEDVKNYHIVIIAGYIEITGSRRSMVYKNESTVLPDVAVFRNCTLCDHSRLLEFVYHPWP